MGHSPLPWMEHEFPKDHGHYTIESADGVRIVLLAEFTSTDKVKSNADFIVLACNNFEELLIAAKEGFKALQHHELYGDPAVFMLSTVIEKIKENQDDKDATH